MARRFTLGSAGSLLEINWAALLETSMPMPASLALRASMTSGSRPCQRAKHSLKWHARPNADEMTECKIGKDQFLLPQVRLHLLENISCSKHIQAYRSFAPRYW